MQETMELKGSKPEFGDWMRTLRTKAEQAAREEEEEAEYWRRRNAG